MYDKNFFSAIDKLVDFAKGPAIQEQMTKSMNETIDNMRVPGAGNSQVHGIPEKKGETKNEN